MHTPIDDTLVMLAQAPLNVDAMRYLSDMAMAIARMNFITAQASHDTQKYGEWHRDYASCADAAQEAYEAARRELLTM